MNNNDASKHTHIADYNVAAITPAIGEREYSEILQRAVAVLESTRGAIARSITTNISNAHWELGKLLYERKLDSRHGDSVVKRLSLDLKQRYPTMGVSPRNLWLMRKFYQRFCSSDAKVQRSVALLPWRQTVYLMGKFHDDDTAVNYYAQESIDKGWSLDLLTNAVKLQMHTRQAVPTVQDNNFSQTLPAAQASFAEEVLRSTYNLGFLGVTQPLLELELERRIVDKIKCFLLELGRGFTYIGNQYPIEYNGSHGVIDLLLYHRRLRCLVAIELKAGKYLPEYAGKMNYYLSILDRTERGEDENPSIGIILCAEKDHVDVELSLDGLHKPIGVADYQLVIPQEELKQIVQEEINEYKRTTQNKEEY